MGWMGGTLTHLCGRIGRRPCSALVYGSEDGAFRDAVAEAGHGSLRRCDWDYSLVEGGARVDGDGYGGGEDAGCQAQGEACGDDELHSEDRDCVGGNGWVDVFLVVWIEAVWVG